jgi:hypothetical protein
MPAGADRVSRARRGAPTRAFLYKGRGPNATQGGRTACARISSPLRRPLPCEGLFPTTAKHTQGAAPSSQRASVWWGSDHGRDRGVVSRRRRRWLREVNRPDSRPDYRVCRPDQRDLSTRPLRSIYRPDHYDLSSSRRTQAIDRTTAICRPETAE